MGENNGENRPAACSESRIGQEQFWFTIVGIGNIGESLSNSIEDVYLVDGLRHNLLSVSQLCDKDNLVVFTLNRCLVVNMDT